MCALTASSSSVNDAPDATAEKYPTEIGQIPRTHYGKSKDSSDEVYTMLLIG